MRLTLLLLLAAIATGQQAMLRRTWPAMSAPGTTAAYSVGAASLHSLHSVTTGAPATCKATLEGSLDGRNWADLVQTTRLWASCPSTCKQSCEPLNIPNAVVAFVRAKVLEISDGATVQLTYAGGR